MGRGDVSVPVVECWTALSMAAGATSRIGVGSFVLNVMNRHPAVVARMASTLQIASGGRLTLGIGIGGHPKEHAAYGIDFPAAPERVARLEEAVAVIRALWTGGPVTRESAFYPLVDAAAYPGAGARATDRGRWRDRGRCPAGRADRRRLVRVRRQLRAEPAALPGVAGGRGSEARGPAGHRGVPGRLARATSPSRTRRGSASRARRGRGGGRPARTGRSSWHGPPTMWTAWWRRPGAGRRPGRPGRASHRATQRAVRRMAGWRPDDEGLAARVMLDFGPGLRLSVRDACRRHHPGAGAGAGRGARGAGRGARGAGRGARGVGRGARSRGWARAHRSGELMPDTGITRMTSLRPPEIKHRGHGRRFVAPSRT